MKGYGPLRSRACKWGSITDSYIKYTIITVSYRNNLTYSPTLIQALCGSINDISSSTQLCILLSKPLLHKVLNLDTVELDLISSLIVFHVLIPIFRNDFNALVVWTGGLCLVLHECTDELLIKLQKNLYCGILPIWNWYIQIKVSSVINSWIGRILISLNKG